MGDLGAYVILYLVAFMLSVFLVPMVRRLAIRVGAVDAPDRLRKIHTQAVPRMGGVAIFIAFIVPVVGAYLVGAYWFKDSTLYKAMEAKAWQTSGLLAAGALMLGLGMYDDTRHASPKLKLIVQFFAGVIICAVGIRIDEFREPFAGTMVYFGWLAYPITIFWVMAVTNAINLIDGMDGLGPGVGLFVSGTMFVLSLFYSAPLVSLVTSALFGAVIGFLIFNFHPAKIFMGDSGSLFIGFMLSAVAVQCQVKRALLVPVIALALPIVDTCMAIIRRWSKGLPMSVPDKQHVHHRLIAMGFSQRQAVFILYGVCVVFGCAALVVAMLESRVAAIVAYLVILTAIGSVAYVLGGRETWQLIRRARIGWARRRARHRAWVRVYQACARMEVALNYEEMWEETREVLDALDVDSARIRLEAAGAEVRQFEWARPGATDILGPNGTLSEGWTLRLPLGGDGVVRGEALLGKDTRRSELVDAIDQMVDTLRVQLVKTATRFATPPAAPATGAKPEEPVKAGTGA